MSRSFRKNPVMAHTAAESDKSDKQRASRCLRSHFRTAAGAARSLDELEFDERNFAHSSACSFAKDGKQWLGLHVERARRGLRVVAMPDWMRTQREAMQAMTK